MNRGITIEKLKELLELHYLWLEDRDKGKRKRKRLDLSGKDLTNPEIIKILRYANLRYADLNGAALNGADLNGANLNGANLYGANLNDANLRYANLNGAALNGVNLRYANLRYADLNGANLRYANLNGAALNGADLNGANLNGANLYGANLNDAKNIPFIRLACPDTGSFIGWKKVKNYIVKLEIPEDAKRCSATTNKCRCEFAKVLEIQNMDGSNAEIKEIENTNYTSTVYKVGEMVYPDSFDENRWNECSNGIHFFINRQDAIDY